MPSFLVWPNLVVLFNHGNMGHFSTLDLYTSWCGSVVCHVMNSGVVKTVKFGNKLDEGLLIKINFKKG